jgi:hypothetical protein
MRSMTGAERDLIRRFAAGDKALRERAVAVFREHEKSQAHSPEIGFMAEATSLAPDHLLQAHYRRMMPAAGDAESTA